MISEPAHNPYTVRYLAIALAVAVISGTLTYLRLVGVGVLAADFTWAWRGAQFLLARENPYVQIRPDGPYPFNDFLYYPLPALLIATPLAWLSGPLAGSIFIGISSGLLCWGLLHEGQHRLILFVSPPYLYALISAQWSPLLTAAALLPNLSFALAAKPNLGLPILAAYPTRRRLLLFGATIIVSLLLLPSWPFDMLGRISAHLNYTPLISWYGPLLLLTLPFWRAAPARLLLALAIMPQRLLYDQLPLWLIPQTPRQALLLTVASWVGVILGLALRMGEMALVCTYLPALGCVLWEHRAQIGKRSKNT
ncbi:MAG: hypothetical protein HGA19_22330 [Oscillochloris sp.]|nr:hypothetical protein [Oscillochloris sp.]